MGIYLNTGNEMFAQATNSQIYVDKTMLIDFTNNVLKTNQKNICVSRPRRFGKSMAAEMLVAYYSKGCDSKNIFDQFKIAKTENYKKYLNKFNVIHIDIQPFVDKYQNIDDMLGRITKEIMFDIKFEFPKVMFFDETDLPRSLNDVYNQTSEQFIFIIDEWDSVFRNREHEKELQKKYLDFIRDLLKGKSYSALCYMTGILPIKKYGQHSALNMFYEYSMSNQRQLAEFVGFTEEETENLCKQYNMPLSETKQWYDGYDVNGIQIYNPNSVVEAMISHIFDNYWNKTETYEALKKYIMMDFDNLKQKITEMIAGEKIHVNTAKFQNDMTTFNSSDDVITLLIHLGYLTYDFETEECWIPNNEVRREFINSIEDGGYGNVMKAINLSDKCLEATVSGNEKEVAKILQDVHEDNTSILKYNDENSLSCVISLAYYTARKSYNIIRELPTGKGFADIVFIPYPNNTDPAMIVELKIDKSTQTAIDQIKQNNYINSLKNYTGNVLLVGINYDKSKKEHTCKIEKIKIKI